MSAPSQDVERFIRLFTRHEPRVFGYILSLLGDPQAAEDVLQEANLVLWKKFDQFEEGTNFFAWACRIARLEVLALRLQAPYRQRRLPPQPGNEPTQAVVARREARRRSPRAGSPPVDVPQRLEPIA